MTSNLTRFQHYRDVYAGAEGDKTSREKTSALAEFSGALEGLAATVAPIGVQVQVSAWCASAPASGEDASALTSCRVVGIHVAIVLEPRQITRHLPTGIQQSNLSFQLNQSVRALSCIDAFGIQPAFRKVLAARWLGLAACFAAELFPLNTASLSAFRI